MITWKHPLTSVELCKLGWPKKQHPVGLVIILLAVLIQVRLGGYSTCLAGTAGTVDAVYNFSANNLLVDSYQPYVYATANNSLKIINSTTLAVEGEIPLPAASYGMAMSPDGNKLFIAGGSSQLIFILDTHARNLLPSLSVGFGPSDLAMGLNNRLFVLGDRLSQMDATTGASAGPDAGLYLHSGALRISPDRRTLFYATFGGLSSGDLYQLDVSSTTPTLLWQSAMDIGSNGEQLALSHNGSMIAYVCGYGYHGYQIPVFRTSDMSLLGVLPTGVYPNCMAFSPDDNLAYALHASVFYGEAVDIYDLSSFALVGQFSVADEAKDMAADQTGQHLFIAFGGDYYGHTEVRVYDTGLAGGGNQPPVARCHDVTITGDPNCQRMITAADLDNGSYDADGDPFTLALTPAGPYPPGTNRVTLTVTDNNRGVSDSCTALVIVFPLITLPEFTCPSNITVDSTSPGGAVLLFGLGVNDTCNGSTTVVCAPSSGSAFAIGTTTVACTATAPTGNATSCQFQITVVGASDMLVRLTVLVREQVLLPQPLLATLEAARASIDRHNTTSAVNQLHTFENKVRAQVDPSGLGLAETLVQAARNIITALAGNG